jgi:hypothetical protein
MAVDLGQVSCVVPLAESGGYGADGNVPQGV